jgi:hypothetical protein
MAMSTQGKILWTLFFGILVLVIIIIPFRFTPVVPESIDTLSVQARAQLIQRFEAPAKHTNALADTLRKAITKRYGGTTPTQDSLLSELEDRADEMIQITNHLRDPRQATFEEKRQDVGKLLASLLGESDALSRQIQREYLQ